MQLGARQEFELSSPLLTVRPIRFSLPKIAAAAALSALATALLWLNSPQGSFLLLFIILCFIILLNLTDHNLLLLLFYTVEPTDSESITRYAINDLSYSTSEEEGRKANHLFIVKIHYINNQAKYFRFKEELYRVNQGIVSTFNEADIIKLLDINDFKEYLRFGLSNERLKISRELFGTQTKMMKPATWDFVKKRMLDEIGILLTNSIFLVATILILQSAAITILLLAINAAIIVLFILDQSSKVSKFHQKFSSLPNKKFKAIRGQNNTVEISFSDVLVGDIIEIDRSGESDEYMTTFRSLLIGNFQVICREGPNREEFIKSPVREIGDVREDRKVRFVIKPLSYIEKATLRGNEYLVVMENNSISKFFALWFQKGNNAEFHPISRGKIWKAVKIYVYGSIIRIFIHIVISVIFRAPNIPFHPDIQLAMTGATFLVPAMIHLLVCWNNHRDLKQLQSSNIQVFDGSITPAGTIFNIVINFSELLELQFQEILYKNLIFDPSSRPFEPDDTTLQNGRTYESLLATILYISMGYYDQEQRKSTFLKQLYKLFDDYYSFQDTLDDTKDIVHRSTGKMWKLVGKDLQNEEGLRSWRIEYQRHLKYVLTEFSVNSQQNFSKYIGAQDQNRSAIYISLAESLIEEGKKLKLLMFKSFKKETASIRETEIVDQTLEQFMEVDRARLEKNMEFAAFVIFDNALKTGNQKIIEFLRDLASDCGSKIFHLTIYSHNKNENLAGFEHILEYIPIHYSFKSHEKTSLIRQKMNQGGTITVGSDIDDQYGELISDISIRINQAEDEESKVEKVLVPADLFINKLQDLREVLSVGMEHSQYQMQTLKYAFLVWFWMLFGWVYVGARGDNYVIDNSPLWAIVLSVIFIYVPLFIRTIFKDTQSLHNYNKLLQIFTFSFVSQIFLSILVTVAVLIISEGDICKLHEKPSQTHMMVLRNYHEGQSTETYHCTNLPVILSGLASIISFVVFFGEETCMNLFEWWRFFIPLVWFPLMIIAAVPKKIILICGGILIFLILIKLMVKLVGPAPKEKSLKESRNTDTDVD